MADPLVVTFGCRLNTFESEVIRREAAAAGSDAIVVNTCAVTAEAVRQARQEIRKLRRAHPERPIVVTGCAAQLAPDHFAAMPEVDRVLGNAEKLKGRHFAADGDAVQVGDIMAAHAPSEQTVEGFEGRARAYVEIQQGCDHRCTFCIIPFGRGPNRSVPAERVLERIQRLVDNGYAEIVLTGVDICSWGADLADQPRLGGLVGAILEAIPALRRLRLSTLDPAAIDDGLIRALGEHDRLMPHLHLSLQAMDDLVLKRMRRRHGTADVFALAERLRAARPGLVFGADLIAGFPTETDAQFERTLAAVDGLGLTYLHVFPYSPREGTPAARMPQVHAPERRARAARLRAAGTRARARYFAARIGSETEVLVEKPGTGRCPWYAPVALPDELVPGTLARVRLVAADTEQLYAQDAR